MPLGHRSEQLTRSHEDTMMRPSGLATRPAASRQPQRRRRPVTGPGRCAGKRKSPVGDVPAVTKSAPSMAAARTSARVREDMCIMSGPWCMRRRIAARGPPVLARSGNDCGLESSWYTQIMAVALLIWSQLDLLRTQPEAYAQPVTVLGIKDMQTFWVIIDLASLYLAISALLAPFVGLGVGLIASRGVTDGAKRGRRVFASFLGGMVAAPLLLWLGMCAPPPGEGIDARRGKRRADVVAAALNRYERRHGSFPELLVQMVPAYVSHTELSPLGNSQVFQYRRVGAGFALAFNYTAPGVNRCEYLSSTSKWSCAGHF
jgi:hypothetical protein